MFRFLYIDKIISSSVVAHIFCLNYNPFRLLSKTFKAFSHLPCYYKTSLPTFCAWGVHFFIDVLGWMINSDVIIHYSDFDNQLQFSGKHVQVMKLQKKLLEYNYFVLKCAVVQLLIH